MAKYSKDSLEKLLLLIDEIINQEENFWFKERLENKFNQDNNLNNPDIVNKLNAIQKYLMIDGVEVIDYSEIKNDNVRNQLFRDCIEMSKYRLGKINDIINFDEYCRYAHMQAEEMVNYFYNEKFYGNIDYIKEFILKHYPTYKFKDVIISLSEITYSPKLTAFIKEYKLDKGPLKSTLEFLSNLRNELSHRNSMDIKNEDLILSELKLKNIDISKSYIDYYNTSKIDIELFKKGRFIFLKRKQDYEEIMMNLNYLKEAIILVLG
jgi:hypothetical protein